MKRSSLIVLACTALTLAACGGDDTNGGSEQGTETGDGDGDPGDGDGAPGDGDGAPGDGDGAPGDGDGAPGDGDGAPGDGDGAPGDGDGAPGDGDGDGAPGDGDGDGAPGDGDGDGDPNACTDQGDCVAGNCVNNTCTVVATCLELEQLDAELPSGAYQLDADGDGPLEPYMAYCDLETAGGGWTLVLKSNGDSPAFHYDSAEWGSDVPYQPENYMLDRTEAKLASYSLVSYTEMMVAMEAPIGQDPDPLQLNWISFPTDGASLYDVISAGGYLETTAGRDDWLSLIGNSALQPACNREGFNVTGGQVQNWHHIRIGIIANEQDDCGTPDSRLGIGGAGSVCGTLDAATGNFAGCNGNNNANILAFGAVFVR